ncbi:MAG: Hsp20 family protein [Blastocatellia bacterium]|nr:Hsp20 family protein [Blastocatellia bacterium]
MQTQKAMQTAESTSSPIFVEAEKLLEQMQKLTQSVAQRAYEFFEERGRMIGHELEDWFRAEAELLRPLPIEMKEDENRFTVRAEVPGFKAEEIKISAEPRQLLIEGKCEKAEQEETEKVVYSERRSNHFCRSLHLAAEIDPAGVSASIKDGVLEIVLPKVPEKQPVGVEVKVG